MLVMLCECCICSMLRLSAARRVGEGDGDGQRLYNCADTGLVGGAGRGQAAAPLLCNDTADGDPLAS